MFRWWPDAPGGAKIVCHECGYGYGDGEHIVDKKELECPRCHKKEKNDIEIVSITEQDDMSRKIRRQTQK